MATEQKAFDPKPFVGQPTKLGLKTGQLTGTIKDGTSPSTWFLSLSWGHLAFYTKAGILVSSVELKGSIIEMNEKGFSVVSAKLSSPALFKVPSEEERRDWIVAIGALMQMTQSHWQDHPIVPVFEILAARATQLTAISKTPSQVDSSAELTKCALDLMTSFVWNNSNRADRIVAATTTFIKTIKTLIQRGCPDEISDSLSQIARQVVSLAQSPLPVIDHGSGVEVTTVSFKVTTKKEKTPAGSVKTASSTASNTSTNAPSTQSTSQLAQPVATNTPGAAGRRTPQGPASVEPATRVAPLETAETLQEGILRLVREIRAQFVRSVEAFKSLNIKNLDQTIVASEGCFAVLRASFAEMIAPLEAATVIQRLKEAPERYYAAWKNAIEVVKSAFNETDKNLAFQNLRDTLPAVGNSMGQASHVLCGAVSEAAQQIFAEQELKTAAALFIDPENSRIGRFLAKYTPSSAASSQQRNPASPRGDDFIECTRKTLVSAQTMVRICRATFFDPLAPEDHSKHLSILERLNIVVDKLITDMESTEAFTEQERNTYLDATSMTRDFSKVVSFIIEQISAIDKIEVQSISPTQALQSLTERRSSLPKNSGTKLNLAQMRFATAARQLCDDLEPLLDMAGIADEQSRDNLKDRKVRASHAPMATSTRFIIHSSNQREPTRPSGGYATSLVPQSTSPPPTPPHSSNGLSTPPSRPAAVPPLSGTGALAKDSSSSQSNGPTSPPSSGSSSNDASGWRKHTKSRNDPVSPRSSNSHRPSLSMSGTHGLVTLTVNGASIEYPDSVNMWIEPEEGNFKYLKGSELENEHTIAAAAAASSSGTSSSSTGSMKVGTHSKTQSAVTLSSSTKSASTSSSSSDDSSLSGRSNAKLTISSNSLPNRPASNDPVLASATLNKLMMKLTSESAVDVIFLKSFLATYRSFTTPEEFWAKLMERYNVPPKPKDSPLSDEAYKQSMTLPIHLRVGNVLSMWLASNWQDISPQLMVHIEYFVENVIGTGEAKGLQKKLKAGVEKAKADKKSLESQDLNRYSRARNDKERSAAFKQLASTLQTRTDPFLFFLEEELDAQAIAEQLTALDWQIYSKITFYELLNKAWSREDRNTSPNVRNMIRRFNEVSSWIATNILLQETLEMRVRVYTKVINTANALFKLHNFNATLAIISGLNNAAIHRLKFTFNDIPKKERAILQTLMEKMSSQGSYKEYRTLLKSVAPPIIPYLGVYLTDLTFIEDGNPNNIGQLINFHKRRLVYRVLMDLQSYQDQAYSIVPDTKLSFFLGRLTFLDDNELYNLSLLREPRGAEKNDIR